MSYVQLRFYKAFSDFQQEFVTCFETVKKSHEMTKNLSIELREVIL